MWQPIACVALLCCSALAYAGCPPEGTDRASLDLLKQQEFTLSDDAQRDTLALALVDCLADPDPALRDGIAYEALTAWMRDKQLSVDTRRKLMARLYKLLDGEDPQGFAHPFAALALSEVARTDRIEPWLSKKERNAMVSRATAYESSVRDYRGFEAGEGWRHGVAHGADWLLQLASNDQVDRKQVDRILAALATQIVPEQAHAYVFGEPGRLARPVVFIAKRGLLSDAEWQTWFTGLADRLGDKTLAYQDPAWLARRHDLIAFLSGLYLESDQSTDSQINGLMPAIVAGVKAVP